MMHAYIIFKREKHWDHPDCNSNEAVLK